MRRTQIYLDEAQDRALAERSDSEGRTKSALIRDAVDAYIARGEGLGVADLLIAGTRWSRTPSWPRRTSGITPMLKGLRSPYRG